MEKNVYQITMPYAFDDTRRGSKYLIGGAYKNHGEFVESAMKHHRGLEYLVNPSTTFDKGSDIESEKMSVKSDQSSLARLYGQTKDEVLTKFFALTVSEKFAWGYEKDGIMTEYIMTKAEFFEFCQEFGKLGVESSAKGRAKGYKVRFNKTSMNMIMWFELKMF